MKTALRTLVCFTLLATSIFGQIDEASWPDAGANAVLPYPTTILSHGPMLGRPTATSMRVWVRTKEPATFKVVYSETLPVTIATQGVVGETLVDDDNTGFADITGLKPNTRYFYGVVLEQRVINNAGDAKSCLPYLADTRMNFEPGFPSFRTLPDKASYHDPKYNPEGRFNFSFGFGFGNRQGVGRYNNNPAYDWMMRNHQDMNFFVMNGDYIYEEARTKENQPHQRDMFRYDYKLYLDRGRHMASFFRHVPTFFMYDDHESFSDLEGTGEIGLKDGKWLYRDVSLKPWYEYNGWANFQGPHHQRIVRGEADLKSGSDMLFDQDADFTALDPAAISTIHVQMGQKNAGVYQFLEIVDKRRIRVRPTFRQTEKSRYSIGSNHYFDWKVGNCHFFYCDVRGGRTRYVPEKAKDEDRFLLGERQRQWLMDGIKNSDADFIFVVTTVSWMVYHTNFHVTDEPKIIAGRSVKEDGFTGAVVERDKLLEFFDALDKPVMILTGDLHNAFILQISDNVWELLIGPIGSANHPIATAGNPPYGGWFDSEGKHVKVKWVSGFPNEVNYQRLRHNYYGIVNVNNLLKSGRQHEAGLHWVAYDEPQVVIQVYDTYTGKLAYAEGISTADAKPKTAVKKPSAR